MTAHHLRPLGYLPVPPPGVYPPNLGPLVFLAGPIQGAPNWQSIAADFLMARGVSVANPRTDDWHGDFEGQVGWEHYHLDLACRKGVVLFWCPPEAEHDCKRAYGQTTRFELGEHVTLHRLQGAQVVVGIDSQFTGARYLHQTLRRKAPNIPICASLDETLWVTLRLLT